MKTFIWLVQNKTKTKFGYKFDVVVYKIVNNTPRYIGSKHEISSGSMMGEQSEALSVLLTKGILPESYKKKTNGYFNDKELAKHKIRFISLHNSHL